MPLSSHFSRPSRNLDGAAANTASRLPRFVAAPLVAEDIAEAIVWTLERPSHVNIDSMIVRPVAQATNTLVARKAAQ